MIGRPRYALADQPTTLNLPLASLLDQIADADTMVFDHVIRRGEMIPDHLSHAGEMVPDHRAGAGKQITSPLDLPLLRIWAPWLDAYATGTARSYRSDLAQFLAWAQRQYLVANAEELTAGIVARWYLELDHRAQDLREIAQATATRKRGTLRRALRYAEAAGLVRKGLGDVGQEPGVAWQVVERSWLC